MTIEKLFTDPLGLFDDLTEVLKDSPRFKGLDQAISEYRNIIASHEEWVQSHLVYNYIKCLVDDVYLLR